jgi:hypothetical protein
MVIERVIHSRFYVFLWPMRILRFIHFAIIALIGISVLSLIAIKAYYSSFTHDESFSYLHYVQQSFMDILAFKDSYTNNHILNSLGMKYSEKIFGTSEFSLRLPNIILFIVYGVFSFLLFKKSHKIIAISFFVLLVTNNPLIDFFGLARGYGLSIGFMMMAIYYLIEALNSGKNKHLILFHLAALLATLSNFTLLNFYLAGIAILYGMRFLENNVYGKQSFSFKKNYKINALLFLFSLAVLYEPVRRVITFNKMDFGGKSGFVDDTLYSVFNSIFFTECISLNIKIMLSILICIIILSVLYLIINACIKKHISFIKENKSLIVVNALVIMISFASIAQHYLFKTDYLSGRFSLFLIPLIILNVGFFFQYLFMLSHKKSILICVCVLSCFSIGFFIRSFNPNSYGEWAYDSDTKQALLQLDKRYKHLPKQSVSLAVSWPLEPTSNFYRLSKNMEWLKPISRTDMNDKGDCYIVLANDSCMFQSMKKQKYQPFIYYLNSQTYLILSQ